MPVNIKAVKLINLETGDVIEADPYILREQCIPEGFKIAEDVTLEEWIQALQEARRQSST